MSLNVFLKVVEIQTKLASLFPFIIGVLFSMTYFGEVSGATRWFSSLAWWSLIWPPPPLTITWTSKKPNLTSINMKKILSDNQAFHHNWSAT